MFSTRKGSSKALLELLAAGTMLAALSDASATPAHKPFAIVTNFGIGGTSIPANIPTALDSPTTIKCTKAKGCTVFFASMVSIFQSDNMVHWSVCPTIDNAGTNPANCPIQDINVGNIVGSWRQNVTVPEGTHTVQTFVLQSGHATLQSWEVDYTVTTP